MVTFVVVIIETPVYLEWYMNLMAIDWKATLNTCFIYINLLATHMFYKEYYMKPIPAYLPYEIIPQTL